MKYVCVVFAMLMFLNGGLAYRQYLKEFPNTQLMPCPPNVDCKGSPYCAGWGHENCLNGEVIVNDEHWNDKICKRDWDNDGFSNGDEMGDPCCEWSYGDTPRRSWDLGHPASSAVKPKTVPTCAKVSSLKAPTLSVVVGANKATVSWTTPRDSCSCWYTLSFKQAAGNTTFSNLGTDNGTFVACGLTASTMTYFTLTPRNLGGAGPPSATVSILTLASANSVDASVCSVEGTIRKAGSSKSPKQVNFVIASIVTLLCGIIFSVALFRLKDPYSKLRNTFLHTKVCCGTLTGEQIVYGLLLILAAIVWFVDWRAFYKSEVYVWGGDARLGRVLGRLAFLPFFLVMLPITRHNVWMHIMGVAFDRAIVMHRWMGHLAIFLTWAHGILLAVEYANSNFGFSFIFSPKGANYPALPGTIAGVCFAILWFSSLEWVRRNFYTQFKMMHIVMLVAGLFLTVLHVPIFAAAIGLVVVLWVADYLLLVADCYLRPTRILCAHRFGILYPDMKGDLTGIDLEMDHQSHVHHQTDKEYMFIKLVFHKQGYHFEHGQFTYLVCPQISPIPHPFTIASEPNVDLHDNVEPGTFTLFIKSMGSDTFSHKLINHPGWKHQDNGDVVADPKKLSMFCISACGSPSIQVDNYDNLMLIAGGIGVTPMSALFSTLLTDYLHKKNELVKTESVDAGGVVNVQPKTSQYPARVLPIHNVHFLWAVRDVSLAYHVIQQMLKVPDDFEASGGHGDDAGARAGVKDGRVRKHGMLPPSFMIDVFCTAKSMQAGSDMAHVKRFHGNEFSTVSETLTVAPSVAAAAEIPAVIGEQPAIGVEMTELKSSPELVEEKVKDTQFGSSTHEFNALARSIFGKHKIGNNISLTPGRPNMERQFQETYEKLKEKALETKEAQYCGVAACGPVIIIDKTYEMCCRFSDNYVQFHMHQENFLF